MQRIYFQARLSIAAQLLLIAFVPVARAADDPAVVEVVDGQGKTTSARLEPGKADKPVPNSAMATLNVKTLELVHKKWKHLMTTMNRSHRHNLLRQEHTPPEQIRPWTAPSVTESSLTRGNMLQVTTNGTPSTAQPGSSATVNEPSVAAVGDYVFYTANWFAAASTDAGSTWSYVNPFTGPFPEPDGQDVCCDQQVHHDPSSNTMFWLQQLIPVGDLDNGTQRVNVDQGSDGTWDCFYDVTPQAAGFGEPSLPDYPDFSISNGHLFVTSNVFTSTAGGFLGAFVGRLPLADITACSPTTADFHTETSFGSFRTTQGAGDTMYFADLESTASIRIWSWPDANPAPSVVTRSIQPFLNGTRACAGPDSRDWCGSIDSRIYGAALAGNLAAFVWTAQQNPAGGFPFPYSQGVVVDTGDNMTVVDQPLIWSNDAAWAYPSLAANSQGGFGGTVLWGGGTHFPQCSAFVADSVNGMSFNPLDHVVTTAGTSGPSFNRSGDYLATRPYSSNDKVYVGTCFAFLTNNAATSQYLLFGRAGDFSVGGIFENGFETGDVDAWSSSSP